MCCRCWKQHPGLTPLFCYTEFLNFWRPITFEAIHDLCHTNLGTSSCGRDLSCSQHNHIQPRKHGSHVKSGHRYICPLAYMLPKPHRHENELPITLPSESTACVTVKLSHVRTRPLSATSMSQQVEVHPVPPSGDSEATVLS